MADGLAQSTFRRTTTTSATPIAIHSPTIRAPASTSGPFVRFGGLSSCTGAAVGSALRVEWALSLAGGWTGHGCPPVTWRGWLSRSWSPFTEGLHDVDPVDALDLVPTDVPRVPVQETDDPADGPGPLVPVPVVAHQ